MKDKTNDTTTIFVYGSLRHGEHNHYIIEGSEFLGIDAIYGKDISTERLAAVIPGDDLIAGEVYNVEGWRMEFVDQLEGIDWGFYNKVQVETLAGRKVYVYFLNWVPQVEGLPELY